MRMRDGFAEPLKMDDESINSDLPPEPRFTQSWSSAYSRASAAHRWVKGLLSINCRSFCLSRRRRRLSGRAVFLVLTIQFLERFSYFGALGHILSGFLAGTHLQNSTAKTSLVQSVVLYVATPLMYPLAGWIGCSWLGQFRMAKWCLGVLWLGYVGIAFVFSALDPTLNSLPYLILVIFFFMLITVGSAGVQVNLIPFGADIVLYKTSDELSSYFYWNYWGRNLGGLAYATSLFCGPDSNHPERLVTSQPTYLALSSFISAFGLTLALSLSFLFGSWFVDDQERQNPPKLIWNVLHCAVSAKRPLARSAFSFTGEVDRPSRLDLAKRQHGGRYRAEEVEDVKTFLQILLLLFSICGALLTFTGITSVMAVQFNHMTDSYIRALQFHLPLVGVCYPSPTSVWIFNIVTIMIAVPLIDQCLYPCLRQYTPNMLKRFGVSYVLLIVSAGILCLYETIGHHTLPHSLSGPTQSCMFRDGSSESGEGGDLHMSAWLTILPIVLVSFAEIFLKVTALEFVYAQSPHSMRAMMVGLFYWIDGLSSTIAALVLFAFSYPEQTNKLYQLSHQSCGFWYYCVFFVLGIVTFVLFVQVAKRYRNRTRGDLDSGRYYRLT